MSQPREPEGAQLVLSILSANWAVFWPEFLDELAGRLGPADYVSPELDFSYTTYYDAELGSPITRRLLGFAGLLGQDQLAEVKLWTNALEKRLSRADGRRLVNLDPGLLTQERLVLATGKNFTHRIYLGQGIFADLTLIYQKGSFRSLAWTFPDYADPKLQEHLLVLRKLHHQKLRSQKNQDIGRENG